MPDSDVVSDYIKKLLASDDPSQLSTPVNMPGQGAVAGVNAGMDPTSAPNPGTADYGDMLASLSPVPMPHAFPTISQATAHTTNGVSDPSDTTNAVKQAIGQKYGFDSSTDSAALQRAQQQAQQQSAMATMAEGANDIGRAFARQAPNNDPFFQQQRQQAQQPVANLQALRQARLQDVGAQSQMAEMSPDSPISKSLQMAYAPLLKKAGISDAGISNASAQDLKNFWQQPVETIAKLKESEDLKRMQLAYLSQKSDQKNSGADIKSEDAFKTSLKSNEAYKEADTTANTADSLVKLVNQAVNNKTSAQSLATELANFASKGKRLHTATVDAFANPNSDLMTRISQAMSKSEKGTITPDVAKDIIGYLTNEKTSALGQKQQVIKGEAEDFNRIHGRFPKLYDPSNDASPRAPQGTDPSAAPKSIDQKTLKNYSTLHYGDASPANMAKATDFLRSQNYGVE